MHEIDVRNVTVGENDGINLQLRDEFLHPFLGKNGNAFRIAGAGQLRRIATAGDAGNLRGGKAYNPVFGLVPEDNIEVMEISTGSPEDKNIRHGSSPEIWVYAASRGPRLR